MLPLRLSKGHGLGNDYLVADAATLPFPLTPARIRAICDRHCGVGSDGILLADVAASPLVLRIFNPDGTEAEKSGNGLRIYACHLWDAGLVGDGPFLVETLGGTVRCQVRNSGASVFVEMGRASFDSAAIPVAGPRREVVTRLSRSAVRRFASRA